jgi:MATE family multidrug resistance protein
VAAWWPEHTSTALIYIGVQSTLSYLIAGAAKLWRARWRSGAALLSFFAKTSPYDVPRGFEALLGRAHFARGVSWLTILFELSLGAALFDSKWLLVWMSAAIGFGLLRRDRFYTRYALGGIGRPRRGPLGELLRLGLPIGGTYLIDVSAFNLVTLLVARLGTDVVGGHAIVANVAATMYMLPLAMSGAAGVLAGQALGRGDVRDARRLALHGTRLVLGMALVGATALALARGPLARAYTDDPQVAAVAISLLGLVAAYHVFDALQVSLAFALRAWKVAVAPMVMFAVALWGVGLVGGYGLAFGRGWGVSGFWCAAVVALAAVSAGLAWLFERVSRPPPSQSPG